MNLFRQIGIVAALNFRNLRHRLWQSLVIVLGMGAVSGVLALHAVGDRRLAHRPSQKMAIRART